MSALSPEELRLWHAWKRATETVRTRVAADITAMTGLSDPDFAVLTRVVEVGDGQMRQSRLADSMGYHRSRLSHHLARMEERGLVTRTPDDNGVVVSATAAGRKAVIAARPVHAQAVRRHLLEPLAALDHGHLAESLEQLAGHPRT